ncbi:unnamed protein product [Notodromas monacha]|uniref:Ectonucleoside triphosphate diphosphohydrolase 1 n=1 Tax=Notodromas monacha TaxID=399045 RepID=A0A7R9BSJ8_9CRUS|nr:unnamed protein product [Notodromas monacha]CAG0919922.1 unnamed protein product [Notodromas monacha]
MNEIRKKLPQKERFSTPIYLGATAGMRLLQMVKPERSQLLMEATRISLSSSGLSLQRCEIITGHEEGIDGWITVNFLQEILYDDDVDIPGKFPPKRKTYGAMDMGGASTQITFEVTEGTPIADPKDEANLRLFGHSYRIFSRSFTCFGINESHRRYLALLYAKSTPGVAISDPCGNAGRVSNVSVSWLFDSPCTQGLQSTTLAETSETVPIVGAWNETECSATIDELLSAEECNKYSNFCFNSSTVPPRIEGTSFIAFSIFYYAASELGLPSSVSEETFYEAALELCSRTYQTMSDLYAGKAGEKIEHVFCFEAFLIYKILRDNYGMGGEEFKLIEFRRKLPTPNGTDVGWALGFMINATNALPEDKPGPPMSSTLFSFLVFVFVGLSTCGSFMAYHSWILCRRRRVYAEYQRLNEPGVRNA